MSSPAEAELSPSAPPGEALLWLDEAVLSLLEELLSLPEELLWLGELWLEEL